MDDAKRKTYIELFERMINMMTDPENFVREKFVDLLSEICELFNIAKGVTEFYTSFSKEKDGDGEIMIDFDNGKGDKVVVCRRFVTKTKAVVKGTLYAEESATFTDEELEKLDLIIRTLLSFVGRNRLQNTIEQVMFYDPAGYRNINHFMRHLDILNTRGLIHGNVMVQINLRQFSMINREVGREAGDIVMRNYYEKLSSLLNEDGTISRLGGDNFMMIFEKSRLDNVLEVVKGIPVAYDDDNDKHVMVSAVAGVFVIPDDYVFIRPEDLFEITYVAVQEAKVGSRGRIIYYDKNTETRRNKMLKIWRIFPDAINNNEFKAYYQPKVDVVSGQIVGAEALCRWIRGGKLVPPMDFIPMLEQNTDICMLDFYMLRMVCKDIRRWIDEGRDPVRVSVNLSRKHLVNVDLLESIIKTIDEYNVPHKYIEIELTETINDVEFKDLKRVVSGLKEAGICTTVDDFGMGYSSLNLIREIPWDVLKIDKCFLPTDETKNTDLMFKHVVAIAQELGLECVTEGVETIGQVGILKDNNCRIAQGFYFDKPLPVEEFDKRLDNRQYEV